MSAHDGAGPGAGRSNPSDGSGSSDMDGDGGTVRRRRLLALLDGEHLGRRSPTIGDGAAHGAAVRGDDGLPARLGRLCAVAVCEVGVDGAGVTVLGGLESGLAGARDQLAAAGPLTRRLEELQLTTGEGPCVDAYRGGRPVLAADLTREPTRWSGFGPEAVRVGVAALFSLPLQVGAVRLGTLDLHRRTPGSLSNQQLSDALTLAVLATEILLELDLQPESAETVGDAERAGRATGWLPDVHADVHVAAGMLSAHSGTTVASALLRLRGHAFAQGEPLHQVARRIIDRELVLDSPDDPGPRAPRGEHDPPEQPPASGSENEET